MKKEDGTPLRKKYKKGQRLWQESERESEKGAAAEDHARILTGAEVG